jgi:hypothetical protein
MIGSDIAMAAMTYTTAESLQEALRCGEITPDDATNTSCFRVVCGTAVPTPHTQPPPTTKSGSSGSKVTSVGKGNVQKEPADEIGLGLLWAWPTQEGTNPIAELEEGTLLHQHADCVDALYLYAHHLASGKARADTKKEEVDLI